MDNCKYIVVDTMEAGPVPLIFPPALTHLDVAKHWFGDSWFLSNGDCRRRILSAGFIQATPTGMVPYGKSDSLDKKCNPDRDADLLHRMFPL
jgi:hypothetical protein